MCIGGRGSTFIGGYLAASLASNSHLEECSTPHFDSHECLPILPSVPCPGDKTTLTSQNILPVANMNRYADKSKYVSRQVTFAKWMFFSKFFRTKEVYILKCNQFNLGIVGKMLLVRGSMLSWFKHIDSEPGFLDLSATFAIYELHIPRWTIESIPCCPPLYHLAILQNMWKLFRIVPSTLYLLNEH